MATSSAWAGGATSRTIYVEAYTISTGLPYTAGLYNTATISAQYVRSLAAPVNISLGSQTATGAWTSGGFVHVGKGLYRLDLPDAALATGVDQVEVIIDGISDVVFIKYLIDLVGSDPRAAATTTSAIATAVASTFGTKLSA